MTLLTLVLLIIAFAAGAYGVVRTRGNDVAAWGVLALAAIVALR